MQRKRISMGIFALMLVSTLGGLSIAARETEENPCQDRKYLELKEKDINSLSTREYDLFKSKDETCNQYKQSDRSVKVMEKTASHSNTLLWITVVVGVAGIVIPFLIL